MSDEKLSEGTTPPSLRIDSVLIRLEEAMHACCDQPLSVDAMTLTRSWRAILEPLYAIAPNAHRWPCEHADGGAGECDSDCPGFAATLQAEVQLLRDTIVEEHARRARARGYGDLCICVVCDDARKEPNA